MPYTWTTTLSVGAKAKKEVLDEMSTPIATINTHCPSNYSTVRSSVNDSYNGSNLNHTSKQFTVNTGANSGINSTKNSTVNAT